MLVLKSSLKSPSVGRVNESLSTSSKLLPRKTKTGESLSFKDRQNSDEAVKKRSAKEKLELTNTGLRSLSAAATPDILKQTPEVTRHSVAVQVDTLEHGEQETTQTSSEEKADALLTAFVQRNRDFEACLVALQVYAQKVSSLEFVLQMKQQKLQLYICESDWETIDVYSWVSPPNHLQ